MMILSRTAAGVLEDRAPLPQGCGLSNDLRVVRLPPKIGLATNARSLGTALSSGPSKQNLWGGFSLTHALEGLEFELSGDFINGQ
jgi:hypothetical protein